MPFAVKPLPDIAYLRAILRYEPETGHLFWRERTPDMFPTGSFSRDALCRSWNSRYAGARAFKRTELHGYHIGELNKSAYKAHRIAWAIATGREPLFIDHINGDKTDNRLVNLRETDQLGNNRNQKKHSSNQSGTTGVCKSGMRWRAYIGDGKRNINLGRYDSFADAREARLSAERRLGYHSNHGRRQ